LGQHQNSTKIAREFFNVNFQSPKIALAHPNQTVKAGSECFLPFQKQQFYKAKNLAKQCGTRFAILNGKNRLTKTETSDKRKRKGKRLVFSVSVGRFFLYREARF